MYTGFSQYLASIKLLQATAIQSRKSPTGSKILSHRTEISEVLHHLAAQPRTEIQARNTTDRRLPDQSSKTEIMFVAARLPLFGPVPTSFLHLPAELRNQIYELSEYTVQGQEKACELSTRPRMECCHGAHTIPERRCVRQYFRPECTYLRLNWPTVRTLDLAATRAACKEKTCGCSTQPAMTRVCRQIREETLPMFYGNRHWFFTMFGERKEPSGETRIKLHGKVHEFPKKCPFWIRRASESFLEALDRCTATCSIKWFEWERPIYKLRKVHKDLVQWIEAIGPRNAAMIRKLTIVYSVKKRARDIEFGLLPMLRKRGLQEGVLDWRDINHPDHGSVYDCLTKPKPEPDAQERQWRERREIKMKWRQGTAPKTKDLEDALNRVKCLALSRAQCKLAVCVAHPDRVTSRVR